MSHEIRTPMNAVIGMTQLACKPAEPAAAQLSGQGTYRRQRPAWPDQRHSGFLQDRSRQAQLRANRLRAGRSHCPVADLMALRVRDKGLELLFDIDSAVPPS
jgi:signal transduction histidine kinase